MDPPPQPRDDGIWFVSFANDDLGSVDLEQKVLRPFDNRDAPLPMSPTLILLVPRKGFEPPTHALRMRCSTS